MFDDNKGPPHSENPRDDKTELLLPCSSCSPARRSLLQTHSMSDDELDFDLDESALQLDLNGDGYLDAGEIASADISSPERAILLQALAEASANGVELTTEAALEAIQLADGMSEEELAHMVALRQGGHDGSDAGSEGEIEVDAAFQIEADADGDGFLSAAEIGAADIDERLRVQLLQLLRAAEAEGRKLSVANASAAIQLAENVTQEQVVEMLVSERAAEVEDELAHELERQHRKMEARMRASQRSLTGQIERQTARIKELEAAAVDAGKRARTELVRVQSTELMQRDAERAEHAKTLQRARVEAEAAHTDVRDVVLAEADVRDGELELVGLELEGAQVQNFALKAFTVGLLVLLYWVRESQAWCRGVACSPVACSAVACSPVACTPVAPSVRMCADGSACKLEHSRLGACQAGAKRSAIAFARLTRDKNMLRHAAFVVLVSFVAVCAFAVFSRRQDARRRAEEREKVV